MAVADEEQSGGLRQIGEAEFEREVLQCLMPVLVGFWAAWSRPCQVLESVLREVAMDWRGRGKVVTVNADDSLDLSAWYDIQSVPTLLFFEHGEEVARVVGTATKEAILARIERAWGSAQRRGEQGPAA